jgi:hypothetical protein
MHGAFQPVGADEPRSPAVAEVAIGVFSPYRDAGVVMASPGVAGVLLP